MVDEHEARDNQLVYQETDDRGRKRWCVQREGVIGPIFTFHTKAEAMQFAVRQTRGEAQIKVRDPKTGQFTKDSR